MIGRREERLSSLPLRRALLPAHDPGSVWSSGRRKNARCYPSRGRKVPQVPESRSLGSLLREGVHARQHLRKLRDLQDQVQSGGGPREVKAQGETWPWAVLSTTGMEDEMETPLVVAGPPGRRRRRRRPG